MQTFELFLPYRCVREALPPARAASPTVRLRAHLEQLSPRLELARASVVSCVAALRHQSCELDEDVANVLQRHVADVLGLEIERMEQLLGGAGEPQSD
jgi:hypothetical protein